MFRAIIFVLLLVTTMAKLWIFAPFHFIYVTWKTLKSKDQYYRAAFLGYDQGYNAIVGPVLNLLFPDLKAPFGNPDRTISGTIGENIRDYPEYSPKAFTVINKWLTEIDPESDNHCVDSIEKDEI